MGIVGDNGVGKTILAKALVGKLPVQGQVIYDALNKIFVSFQSEFQLKHGAKAYRQQRWNWYDPELVPTVREELSKIEDQTELQRLIDLFGFAELLDLFVISLSNGEQRKFELIKALENYASASARKKIVLDAREPAVGFYQKLGYEVLNKSYRLFDEIQHFRMVKYL